MSQEGDPERIPPTGRFGPKRYKTRAKPSIVPDSRFVLDPPGERGIRFRKRSERIQRERSRGDSTLEVVPDVRSITLGVGEVFLQSRATKISQLPVFIHQFCYRRGNERDGSVQLLVQAGTENVLDLTDKARADAGQLGLP